MFLDRGRTAGPYLRWKVRLFTAGAGLALAGIYLEETWLVSAAIVVLGGGVLLRFLPRRKDGSGIHDGPQGPPA